MSQSNQVKNFNMGTLELVITSLEFVILLCLQECVSDDIAYLPDLASLGVHDLMPIEERACFYLLRFRRYNYYEPVVGEFPEPEHPPYIQF